MSLLPVWLSTNPTQHPPRLPGELSDTVLSLDALIAQDFGQLPQLSHLLNQNFAMALLTEDGVICDINPVFSRLTDWSKEHLVGRPFNLLLSTYHPPSFYLDIWQTLSGGLAWQGDIQCQKASREPVWLSLNIISLGVGEDRYYLVLGQDNSLSKSAENELFKLQNQVKTALQSKSEFLARISHELRTPLNGVFGSIELLQDSGLDSDQTDYLDTLKGASQQLLHTIEDIMDFAKIDSGVIQLFDSPFDPKKLNESVCNDMAHQYAVSPIEFIVDYPPALPNTLFGDSDRLRQILRHLLSNAFKFTRNGHVVLRIQWESQNELEGQMIFEVEDTGIGISEHQQKLIFEEFSQGDGSSTRSFSGCGLGLALVKQLVSLMGGEISLKSAVHQGSTFTVRLALKCSPISSYDDSTVQLQDTLRILVVDDNDLHQRVMQRQLTPLGHTVASALTAREAMEQLTTTLELGTPYDLVIIDYQMPQVNGEMLGKMIRENPAFDQTALIMLTACANSEDAQRFLDNGFSAYLSKPVHPYQLIDTMRWVMIETHNQNQTFEAAITRGSGEATRLLLVEDNDINIKVTQKLLQKLGFMVDIAKNGQEAVAMAKASLYPIILMDCQMPVMDGYQATLEIRRSQRWQNQRSTIIALTAHALNGDHIKCLESGMDAYIAKPVTLEGLQEKLSPWLTESSQSPAP